MNRSHSLTKGLCGLERMINTPQLPHQVQTMPVMDQSFLHDVTLGDPELVKELLTIYLDDVTERLQRIPKHIAAQDLKAIHLEVHSIKGSSASIGARQMHKLVVVIESYLLQKNFKLFHQLLPTVHPTLQSVRQFLQEFREKGFSS